MKEQIKTPEKELSDEEIANLSDAEFKILAIRMLTEMVEYGCKMEVKRKTHHNYITQDKREGENLKSSKRKGDSYLQRSSHKTIS